MLPIMYLLATRFNLFGATVNSGDCNSNPGLCDTGVPAVEANSNQVTQVLQIVFGLVGVIAVVILIWGGFQLMTSFGSNPEAAGKARRTIIYAAIGLAIAVSAEFMVSFVLNK